MGDFRSRLFGRGCGAISATAGRRGVAGSGRDEPAEGHDYDTGEYDGGQPDAAPAKDRE